MPTIDLDWFVNTAEQKFGDLTVPIHGENPVTLRNALRLPKELRRELNTVQKRIDNLQSDDEAVSGAELLEGEDQTEAMTRLISDALRLLADSKPGADRLLEAVSDNLPALLSIFEEYGRTAQPGEASPSGS